MQNFCLFPLANISLCMPVLTAWSERGFQTKSHKTEVKRSSFKWQAKCQRVVQRTSQKKPYQRKFEKNIFGFISLLHTYLSYENCRPCMKQTLKNAAYHNLHQSHPLIKNCQLFSIFIYNFKITTITKLCCFFVFLNIH